VPEPRYLGDKPSEPPKPDYLKLPSTTARSQQHEKSSAKRAGKRRVPGSGNQLGKPGDIVGDEDLGELKTTKKTDTRIELKWLRKIAYEAMTMGKKPMIEFEFVRLKAPCPQKWVMVPADYFDDLQERARP